MKNSKAHILFIAFTFTIASGLAQDFRIPQRHITTHKELLSQQKHIIETNKDSIKIEKKFWVEELQNYFYPFAKFSYIISPNSENPNLVATYSLSNGNILTKTIEMWNGYSTKKMSEDVYKLTLDDEKRAIVSTLQVIQNMMGRTRRASDRITMFVLPKDGNPVKWTETVNGEESNCSAKIVYITFTCEGKKLYRKAVKIEKTTPLDKTSSVKEWSYWVKGLSRLATYGYWGDPKKVSCIDKSVNINLDDPIREISKAEYDRIQ